MATQSPFLSVESFTRNLTANFPVPAWAVDEVQRRIVLLLNHVLMQEPAAMGRLVRQKGSVVLVQWSSLSMRLLVTPAGLLDLAGADAAADLSLVVADESPTSMARTLLRGDKPPIRIEGDVQLAAEVNWLVDNVRWDIEEDLSRLVGDAPAHAMGQAVRRMARAARQFAFVGADRTDAGGTAA